MAGEDQIAEVVVVTHDVPVERVAACIDSLRIFRPADPWSLRILLVHNGPDPAALVAHAADWPEVTVIPTVNRGYGAAVNLGLSATTSDRVMVLNDDVVVTPGWWEPLVTALEGDPGLGAVAPLIMLAGTDRVNSAGVRLGSDGAGVDIGYGQPVDAVPAVPTEIEMFSGGAFMMRRAMWEALGGFDTRYFLYYEDVDLARRGAEAGWRYRLIPDSRVTHAQGSTTSAQAHRGRVAFLQERNRLWIALRFGTPSQILGALWLSVRRLRHPPQRIHARALAAGLAAAGGLMRERWIAGRSLRAR